MFRVVYSGSRNGFYNTAIDPVLLRRVERGESPDTIVISQWDPTVSVSHSQSMSQDVDIDECHRRDIDCVRREGAGKSVYLDNNYIVFSLVMKHYHPFEKLGDIRQKQCQSVIDVLKSYKLPVQFHQPDNIIVSNGKYYRTMGNAGQKLAVNGFYLQGSVRYDLPEESFDNLIHTLKAAGESLVHHQDTARKSLACVREYKKIAKDEIAKKIAQSLASTFNASVDEETRNFEQGERKEISQHAEELRKPEWLADKPENTSLGICYFFLNGVNMLPMNMTYNPPSRL